MIALISTGRPGTLNIPSTFKPFQIVKRFLLEYEYHAVLND